MRLTRLSFWGLILALAPQVSCDSEETEPVDAAGGGAGGAPISGAPSLFPLARGFAWTYRVTSDGDCEDQGTQFTREVTGPTDVDGREAFEVTRGFCTDATETFAWDDGELFQFVDDAWTKALYAPLDESVTWEGAAGLHGYGYVGDIIVPAGRYGGCWRRYVDNEDALTLTFCPRVGIVRASKAGYLAELSGTEF